MKLLDLFDHCFGINSMRTGRKISDLPKFPAADLLLAAQKRGIEIIGPPLPSDATAVMLVGLASILEEHNIGGIREIANKMEKAK